LVSDRVPDDWQPIWRPKPRQSLIPPLIATAVWLTAADLKRQV